MSFATAHNDYLDPDRHLWGDENYEEDYELIIDALKPYDTGRWEWDRIDCCITGKDADLEPWGPQGIEIVSCDDGGVKCIAHIGKTFAGSDVCLNLPESMNADEDAWNGAVDAYLEQAQEVVCGCNLAGEWTGEDWWLCDNVEFSVDWVMNDDTPDYAATAKKIVKLALNELAPLEDELRLADQLLDQLAGWITGKDNARCEGGAPGPEAAWINAI